MSKQGINLMLTCANSQVAPSIIQLIKCHPLFDVRVFGCDISPAEDILGRHFCERCFSVPPGIDKNYVKEIAKIVDEHQIRVIMPGSDEESFSLSQNKKAFSRKGCEIACSDSETIAIASNKYKMMKRLMDAGIHSGAVFQPKNLDDIDIIAKQLRYPDCDIVIKPQVGRGSRGFRVVASKFDRYSAFCSGEWHKMSLEGVKQIFENHEEELADYLMMEMYPGDKYSADVLVSHGKVISMVIRNNGTSPKIDPPTQIAEIVFDEDVRQYTERIVELMGFDYFVQVEVGRNAAGNIGLVEINTRIDATLPITAGLGLNFFHEMITYAVAGKMRSDIPDYLSFPKQLRFRRYWKHLFEELPYNM